MERMLLTTLTPDELRQIVVESVRQCLKTETPILGIAPNEAAPNHVTKREAARLLSCSQSSISNFARAGKLRRFYVGKSVRFERREVLGLAKAHTNGRANRAA